MLLAVVALTGCARLGYYAHLGRGGLALVTRGESVEKILGDADASPELKDRLRLARSLVDFAVEELDLPATEKYRKYLDLERPYVVWTVVATPEFSLEPRTWCFPVAGCVGYRGYFSAQRAERFAQKLRGQGLDATVGGVRAFSSLGWFGDPLLNTFLFDSEPALAGLLFHELAHGRVFVKDDTAFNESFASAVERAGVRLWLAASNPEDTEERVRDYTTALGQLDAAYATVASARERLEALYATPEAQLDADRKRVAKAGIFADLQRELAADEAAGRAAFAGWIGRDLNNADLASIGFYREQLTAIEGLLEAVDGDLSAFYRSAECLADLEPEERRRRLDGGLWGSCILSGSR